MAQAQKKQTLQQQTQQYIEACRADPVNVFVRGTLRHRALPGEPTLKQDPAKSWELDQFQIDIVNAMADVWREKTIINHERRTQISIVSGHGPGKTHTAALLAHVFNACYPGRIIVTAPKFAQVKTRMFAAIHKIDRRAEPWYRATHHLGETAGYWHNSEGQRDHNWCIVGETAKTPENLAGHHSEYQLVIVEEATGVPESLYPVIFGALSTGVIQILVMISNPTTRAGTFADSHLKATEAEHYFRYKVGFAESSRVSRKWANRLIEKYGRESPIVKVRVFGEFASDDPGQIIALQWLQDARNADTTPDGSRPRRRISADISSGGEAETVLIVADHYQTKVVGVALRRFSYETGVGSISAAEDIEKMWKEFNCDANKGDDVVVDAAGVGDGTYGHLLGVLPVVRYMGGAESSDPKRWRNRRCQSYLAARDAFREQRVSYLDGFMKDNLDWDDFDGQLCSIRSRETGDKLEDLEPKADLVERTQMSPDLADAWAMQFTTMPPVYARGQAFASLTTTVATHSKVLEGLE